jgi:hypothetical protein
MKSRSLSLLATVGFIGMVAMNALAVLLPINGMDTGTISNLYPSLFTPAGFTFSIWSLIYLGLLVFVVAQWFYADKVYLTRLLQLFGLSCAANMLWIVAWHYLLPGIALIIMLALLLLLILIFLHLQDQPVTTKEKVLLQLPFHVYLGWISVATLANVAAWLVSMKWAGGPFTQESWTMALLVMATLLSLWMTIRFHAYFYSAVTVWALYGIFSRWSGGAHPMIATIAFYSALMIVGAMAVTAAQRMLRNRIKR